MDKHRISELDRRERQMKYRFFLLDVMHAMDDDYEDENSDAEWEQLRTSNPEHFKVAVFHAGANLHMRDADGIEAGEAQGDESPDNLRHLAADQFAYAWGFAEELGDDDLLEEVLRDARSNGEVYEEASVLLEKVRMYLETMRRIDALEARAGERI